MFKPEIQQPIYLIGREAAVNASRHSNASRIEVEVGYRSPQWQVVRDNGRSVPSATGQF
jgi:signal transduction histidine kinase